MQKQYAKTKKLIIIFGACIGWFAIILQLYLIIASRVTTIGETIIRFFSFFTILTNILVALCLTFLINPNSRQGRFFSSAKLLTAIAVYISVVGIVYNIILRQLWSPEGLQKLADELLHSVIPLLFFLFWLLFAPKNNLQYKNVLPWLLYPFVYVVYILLLGASSGFYPYPFINVTQLGYGGVFYNSFGLFVTFLFLSVLFVAIAKMMNRKSQN